MSHDKDFLSFDEAVTLTRNLEDFFNSEDSDQVLEFLKDKFDLEYRSGFHLKISNVVKNHHACTGCTNEGCVAGCYMSHNGVVSYTDKALTKILGARLVIHEVAGHAVYEQIFDDGLSPNEHFDKSEEFAQFVENHFNRFMQFISPHDESEETYHNITMESFTDSIISGVALAFGFALAGVIIKKLS